MHPRVLGSLVAVLGLLVVLGGILAGGIGVSTGGLVTGVDCGSYFSPDETAAKAKDESLVQRDWKDVLRGKVPEAGTQARDECRAAVERRAVPVWSAFGVGVAILGVGVAVAVLQPGVERERRAEGDVPGAPAV